MKFFKYHALGNDYLILDTQDARLPSSKDIQRICHRNFGIGSDGILYGPLPSRRADFAMQIWNPDGSEAEKSGNGLRIFSQYLFDTGRIKKEPFQIETLGGVVRCTIHKPYEHIEVEMGRLSFNSRDIPLQGAAREVLNEKLIINKKTYRFYAATIGNPHVVIPMKNPTKKQVCEIGPLIENMTSLFPNRTNVQLLKILDRSNIQIEIWERGAGYTLASGSSSSAAAAVAHKMGLCDNPITVHCPGGDLLIGISHDYSITLTGPVARVNEWLIGI